MAKQPLVRVYKMNDAALIQRADLLGNTIARDSKEFATRKVDQPRLEQMKEARERFSDFPTDFELLGPLTQATLQKDALRGKVQNAIRTIRGMANQVYEGKGIYQAFGFDDLSRQNDEMLCRTARRAARTGLLHIDDLAAAGLTQELLNELTALAQAFDDAIDATGDAVHNRDVQTQQRVLLGNALYAHVTALAEVGKDLFQDTDEARYNDYLIVDEPSEAGKDNTPAV